MSSFGQSNSSVRAWVRERFAPMVMVVASEGVESTCREKNGLSFVDILRPYSEQTDLNIPLRISGQNIRITETRLRFSYAYTMEQPTAEAIDAHLRSVIQHATEGTQDFSMELDRLVATPWFLKYRQDFLRLLCFDAHETHDHPLGCIYAVSSTEVDSLKAFEDLVDSATLPTLMLQDYMSPVNEEDFAKLFVIVHDGSREGQTGLELAREKVRIVQKEYGFDHCALLLINTAQNKAELRGTPPIAFEDLRPKSIVGGGAGEHANDVVAPTDGWGCYLSKADLERVNELVRNFITRCFFPKLDIRLARLFSLVSHKRKSLTGRLMDRTTSLLRSSLTSIRDPAQIAGFKFYSDEAQMRQLGDILFLLGRYEDALQTFQAISISKDTYPKFYAGIQFMIGLCFAMLVGFADPGTYFSRAYDFYLRTPGKTCRMFATRAALILSAHCLSEGNHFYAAAALLKGYDTEEMLRGALLLEHAAILLLKMSPPSYRKFAFYMTLSGVWFLNCMFHGLSLRCYTLVLGIYANRRWTEIENHIAAMMLKFHLEQNNKADAFSWTIHVLTSQPGLPSKLQKEYLQWICNYIEELPSNEVSSLPDFNLPLLHLDTVAVEYDGEVVSNTTLSTETENSVWQHLESRFRDPFSASTTTGFQTNIVHLNEAFGWVVCGEAIRLTCDIENPLQAELDVTSAQLLFEFERTDDSCSPTSSPVALPERNFHLKPSERTTIQLELIPQTPGRLRIIGMSWYLNGRLPGHKLIGEVGWKASGWGLPFRARSNYPTLLFVALEPVPRLILQTAPFPSQLWKGEVWKSIWDFESVGKVGFRNLQLTASNNDFSLAPVSSNMTTDGFFFKNGVYQVDYDFSKKVPFQVCLNPQIAGRFEVHILVRYEAPQSDTSLRVRFLRHSFAVDVIEALSLRSWVVPSEVPEMMVLGMELENRISDVRFEMSSVADPSGRYSVEHPSSNSTFPFRMAPEEKRRRHLLLVPSEPESNGDLTSLHERPAKWQPLGICFTWTSFTAENGNDKAVTVREGRMEELHDLSSLFEMVAMTIDSVPYSQTLQNGVAVFPLALQIRNIGQETISACFEAGTQRCLNGERWKQKFEDDVREAGLPPIPTWTWTGQNACHIPELQPSESFLIQAEIICLFPGTFCISNYHCKWKSCSNGSLSGTTQGLPLYLTVLDDLHSKSIEIDKVV